MHFTYHMPTQILFGRGKLQELSQIPLPGKKALIVITNGKSMLNLGYVQRVSGYLQTSGVQSILFDKALPEPDEHQVMSAVELARNENCDFIIGLGGRGAIDTAKAIAVMINNPGKFWEYMTGNKKIDAPVLPIVTIPTTSGTGSEITQWLTMTNKINEKIGFGSKEIFPVLSIIDTELMTSVPTRLTAYQGMEAFFKSVEGYLTNIANPTSNLYAWEAIHKINIFLPQAVCNGNNLQAREEMALASLYIGMIGSMSACLTEHSIEQALSAFYPELPHGAGLVAMAVPYFSYLLKNRYNKVKTRYCCMAKAMGKQGDKPEDFIDAVKELISKVGLNDLKLSEWDITEAEAEKMVVNSFASIKFLLETDNPILPKTEGTCILRSSIN